MKTSGTKRIAERYVRALFEVAQSGKLLDAVEKDMHSLAQLLKDSEELRNFINNPLMPRDHQADAMLSILATMGAQQITRQFVAMLTHQKRLTILPAVVAMFLDWVATARGEMTAQVISAAPLSKKEVALVGEGLSAAYKKKVNLHLRQDPALLGGIVVNIGSLQLDSSLAGKMNRLKRRLQAA